MCFFMYAITDREIEGRVIERIEKERLYVRNNTALVKDKRNNCYYYDVNNGHCACEIIVSPFSRIKEVKELLQDINEKGDFRFLVFETEEEDINEYLGNNTEFEKKISEFGIQDISMEKLLELYPDKVEFEKIYHVIK